jgi:hypothetical protein
MPPDETTEQITVRGKRAQPRRNGRVLLDLATRSRGVDLAFV